MKASMETKFCDAYQALCDGIAETCKACLNAPHDFSVIETSLENFWEEQTPKNRPDLDSKSVLEFAERADKTLHTSIVKSLMKDVFQNMTGLLTKQIRNFAKCYSKWIEESLEAAKIEGKFKTERVKLASSFAQRLRRYTGLNHLAQAARTVLSNPSHITHMLEDYLRIDFANVQTQVKWMCDGCDEALVTKHEEAFRHMQQVPATSNGDSLENWATWMQGIVADALGPKQKMFQSTTPEGKKKDSEKAGELLLRWSFVSNLILRDLTLKSAISFGPFHLMRLLCDEYMYFLVENAVAEGGFKPVNHVVGGGSIVGQVEGDTANKKSDREEAQDSGTSSGKTRKHARDEGIEKSPKKAKLGK
eukprot:m.42693 g.42693  ORF g.42693 m.42693 type:complete len:362 (-) comp9902_c0_seq1:1430-2515(-)